jgi:hypothetical protein
MERMAHKHKIPYSPDPANRTRSTSNHRILSQFGYPAPSATARPVVILEQSGSNKVLTVAYERSSGGITAGTLSTSSDLGSLASTSLRTVSSNGSDSNPVVISYPSAYGYSARKYVYYLAGGYAAGRRLVQFDWVAGTNSVIPGGYSDYTYYSLQGAWNPSAASFDLVTEGWDTYYSRYFVNLYAKPTYTGNSAPSLSTSYANMRRPTLMVENNSGFGNPTVEIDMISGSTWYKASGGGATSIGSTIDGIFTRDIVAAGDRATILCRNTVTPSRLERYIGTGPLSKSVGDGNIVDLMVVRQWGDSTSGVTASLLDFAGASVQVLDSIDAGENGIAVKVLSPASDGTVVRQAIDSLAVPLEVEVVRGGKMIYSFAPSTWTCLTMGSLGSIQSNDVLLIRPVNPLGRPINGYTVYTIQTDESPTMGKNLIASQSDRLALKVGSLAIYPNPFNPSTELSFTLGTNAPARLAIYDMLGREVIVLLDEHVDAGSHTVRFDGSKLASGTYLCRLQAGTFVKTQRLVLLK